MIMKRFCYILIMMQLLFVGCFEDDSNTYIRDLNPIEIMLDGGRELSVMQMDTLRVEPLIFCKGVPDDKLKFEWMFMSFGTIVPEILDTNMYFCAQITAPPANNYTLRLTVTDETTGIFRIETYSVTVHNGFREGLLIADTKDNGMTSDLSLVKCREFTSDSTLKSGVQDIDRDIWTAVNDAPFDGTILAVNESNGFGRKYAVNVVTTKTLYQANYTDFKAELMGDELFYVKPPFSGQDIHSAQIVFRNSDQNEVMMVNGLVYQRNLQNDVSYGTPLYPNGVDDYNVTMIVEPTLRGSTNPVYAYDAKNKQMLFTNGRNAYKAPEQLSGSFDVNDLSDYEPFFLGRSMSGVVLLAKNLKTAKLEALIMNVIPSSGILEATNIAKEICDVTQAQNISQAKYYAIGNAGNALYYATETGVYTGSLENMGGTASLQWQPTPGETITGLTFYNWWGGGEHDYIDANGRVASQPTSGHLLLITTQKADGSGKVTGVPVLHQHMGYLEQNKKYHVVMEGFGKILGIYKQID